MAWNELFTPSFIHSFNQSLIDPNTHSSSSSSSLLCIVSLMVHYLPSETVGRIVGIAGLVFPDAPRRTETRDALVRLSVFTVELDL